MTTLHDRETEFDWHRGMNALADYLDAEERECPPPVLPDPPAWREPECEMDDATAERLALEMLD